MELEIERKEKRLYSVTILKLRCSFLGVIATLNVALHNVTIKLFLDLPPSEFVGLAFMIRRTTTLNIVEATAWIILRSSRIQPILRITWLNIRAPGCFFASY